MKEIRFRGLRTDGKGWVYGMLFHNNKIVTETVSYESPLVEKGSPCYKYEYINIIPESVGQFTGLKDINVKEIYEGDIFKINSKMYFIEWNDDVAGFILTTGIGYNTSNMIDFNCDSIYYSEIIGSIHTTPELINN